MNIARGMFRAAPVSRRMLGRHVPAACFRPYHDKLDSDIWRELQPSDIEASKKTLKDGMPSLKLDDTAFAQKIKEVIENTPRDLKFFTADLDQSATIAARPEDFVDKEAKENLKAGKTTLAWNEHPDAGAIGTPGLFEKWGAVPIIGSIAAIILSKEFYILDEEFLTAACFGGFIFTAFITQGESVKSGLQQEISDMQKEYELLYDAEIRQLEMTRDVLKQSLQAKNHLESFAGAYNELATKFAETRHLEQKRQLIETVEAALEDFASVEKETLSAFVEEFVRKANAHVTESFSKDSKLQEQSLDNAIKALADPKASKDLLTPLYSDFLKSFQQKRSKREAVTLPEDVKAESQDMLNRAYDTKPIDIYETLRAEYSEEIIDSCREEIEAILSKYPAPSTTAPKVPDTYVSRL